MVERLRQIAAQLEHARLEVLQGLTLTPTGLSGLPRAWFRTVVEACGGTCIGDLVRCASTHLVVCSAAACTSLKCRKAAEWGIPCLRLDWLLDSVSALDVQPPGSYVAPSAAAAEEAAVPVGASHGSAAAADEAPSGSSGQPAAAPAQQPWQQHQRPSSVGSNHVAPGPQPAGRAPPPPQELLQPGAGAGGEAGRAAASRPALAAVDANSLLEHLRTMSISPEPSAVKPGQGGSAGRPCRFHGEHEEHEQEQVPPSGGSSQQSLSMQGMVRRAGGSSTPGTVEQEGSELPGPSPMAASPAVALHGGPQPFAFSPAVAGSPMQESPAPRRAAAPRDAVASQRQTAASRLRRSSSQGTSSQGAGSQDSPMASFPTPSVLRGWSDEMEAGEGEYSPPTQTPQCIRDALQLTLDAAGSAAEHVDLQQQAFQEGCSPPQPEQTPASAANRVCAWEEDGRQQAGAAGATLRTPAALRDWTDDETDIGEEPSPNNAVDDPAEEAEGKEAPWAGPVRQPAPASRLQTAPAPASGVGPAGSSPPQHGSSCGQGLGAAPPQPGGLSDLDEPLPPPPALADSPAGSSLSDIDDLSSSGAQQCCGPLPASRPGRCSPPAGAAERSGGPGDAGASPQAAESCGGAPAPSGPEQHVQSSQQQGQPQRALRDWSEDDSEGEVPSPDRGRHMGWSGLTQLDPAAIKIARPRAAAPALPAGADAAGGGVVALKLLQRPPRNNCVKDHHGLTNLKQVAFAEAVHIPELGLQLSSKDKKTAAALRRPPGAGAEGGAGGAGEEPALAEPCTFYRVPSGAWFLEFHRYFTAAQAEAAAAAAGCRLALPAGFDRSMELVKSVEREYAPLADVVGGQAVKKVKTSGGAPMLSLRGSRSRSYFWRWALDPRTGRLLTDQPASDFLLGE